MSHPAIDTRDVASFVPFRTSLGYKKSQKVPLKTLVNKFMGRDIGHGYEHPVSTSPHQRWSLILSSCLARDRSRMFGPLPFSDALGGPGAARPMAVHHPRRCARDRSGFFHLVPLPFHSHFFHGLFSRIGLMDLIITSYYTCQPHTFSHSRILTLESSTWQFRNQVYGRAVS